MLSTDWLTDSIRFILVETRSLIPYHELTAVFFQPGKPSMVSRMTGIPVLATRHSGNVLPPAGRSGIYTYAFEPDKLAEQDRRSDAVAHKKDRPVSSRDIPLRQSVLQLAGRISFPRRHMSTREAFYFALTCGWNEKV